MNQFISSHIKEQNGKTPQERFKQVMALWIAQAKTTKSNEEQLKTNSKKKIIQIVSNYSKPKLSTNESYDNQAMQAYKLSDIDEKELVFGRPQKSGNGFIISVALLKQGLDTDGNPDGILHTVPLLIESPTVDDIKEDTPKNWCFCFGVKQWESKEKKKISNYTTGIVIQRTDNPSPYLEQWLNNFNQNIVKACAQAVVNVKNDVKKPNLTLTSDSLSSGTFSRLEEKNGSMILNLKLRQDSEGVDTEFLTYPDLKVIPFKDMIGKKCNVKFEILIDGIFVGPNAITIQAKLDRACVADSKKRKIVRQPMKLNIGNPIEDENPQQSTGFGENEIDIPVGDDIGE